MNSERDRAIGAGTQVFTEVSINFGSALAGILIPVVGTVAIVTARQLMTAIFVLPFYRAEAARCPAEAVAGHRARRRAGGDELHLLRVGRSTRARHRCDHRVPRPLALALVASRRLLDVVCAFGAGAGVVLLTGLEGELDLSGWCSPCSPPRPGRPTSCSPAGSQPSFPAWKGSRSRPSSRWPPAADRSLVVDWSTFNWTVVGLLVAGGILSSALPYSLDTFILRRITPRLYAIITSCGPAIAAVFGVLILSESLDPLQMLGIVAVCTAGGRGDHHPARPPHHRARGLGTHHLLTACRGIPARSSTSAPLIDWRHRRGILPCALPGAARAGRCPDGASLRRIAIAGSARPRRLLDDRFPRRSADCAAPWASSTSFTGRYCIVHDKSSSQYSMEVADDPLYTIAQNAAVPVTTEMVRSYEFGMADRSQKEFQKCGSSTATAKRRPSLVM